MAADSRTKGPTPSLPGIVESPLAGLRWPSVPQPRTAAILALHEQLLQSQWWDAQRLEALQLWQLAALLTHAARTVPHYRKLLRASAQVDPAFLRTLPILTRAQVQEAPAALVSSAVPQGHGAMGEVRSSGSTGRPVELKQTRLTALFRRALYLREHVWQKRDFRLAAAVIRNFKDGSAMPPEGKREGGWGYGYSTRPVAALNIRATVAEQLAWLDRVRPAYLATFPTNVRELANEALARGMRLAGLRQVSTYAETPPPGIGDLIGRAFGAAHSDIYSSEETGPIAFQCERGRYHVQSENLIVEAVDEQGRPCAPGVPGRVLVTDLHNFATPLVRYEIGDYAEPGPPCECGRGLPVLARVLGRTRGMLRLAGGGARWPTLPSGDELGRIAPVRQFQLVQKGLRELELLLVAARPLAPGEEKKVREAFLADLGGDFELRVAYADAIPRSASGKYEDFRSEVP